MTITKITTSCFLVQLSAIGIKKVMMPVQNLKEASDICRIYIEENNLGGSNWTGGKVLHPVIGSFARVSYNGRVWDTKDKEITDLMQTC